MTALLGTILVVAVGWSFFMGFMVGRGQNPETRVEQMTGMLSGPAGAQKTKPAPSGTPSTDAPSQAGTADAQQPPAQTADKGPEGTPAAQPARNPAEQQPAPSAYPFAHPTGNSLAAWGIKPSDQQETQGRTSSPATDPKGQTNGQAAGQTSARPATQQARAAAPAVGPKFDFVYQVAAFKSADDANRLRGTLEGKGLRTRTRKSGKLTLVLVNLRGTEDDAFRLREDLQHMRLGVPIKISQKPVGKPAKKAR